MISKKVNPESGVPLSCLPAYFEAYDAYAQRVDNEVTSSWLLAQALFGLSIWNINIDKAILDNINTSIDIDKDNLENIDIYIDMDYLGNIGIDIDL